MDSGASTHESPVLTEKGKSESPRKRKASVLEQKSLAEFFAENKNIAGFDNAGKALYTTVRELVKMDLILQSQLGSYHKEIHRSCYDSTINEKLVDKNGIKVEEPTAAKLMKGGSIYRVTCKDNGRGMHHDAIPEIFGQVSFRKKYGMKQRRGKFGFGAQMVSVWSKMSTGVPIEIYTGMKNEKYRTSCSLDIDIHRNIPIIHSLRKIKSQDGDDWHGAKITVEIKGNWTTYGSKILEYMRQIAVVTPYAKFKFEYFATAVNGWMEKIYPRISDKMPPVPVETKFHPLAVDSPFIIQRLIGQSQTLKQNLLEFLLHEFINIDKAQAENLIGAMGPDITSTTQVNSLTFQQIDRMYELFQQAKFDDPSGSCLSCLGELEFAQGIYQRLNPDVIITSTANSAQVYQGHPFIVEAGVSLGGQDLKQGFNIFRFANCVPLLFEQDADVVTTAIKRIDWKFYRIDTDQFKVGIYVDILSTKIPFEGTGLEYIRDDITEIADFVKTCLEDCCKELEPDILRAEYEANLAFNIEQASTYFAIMKTGDPDAQVKEKKRVRQELLKDYKKPGFSS